MEGININPAQSQTRSKSSIPLQPFQSFQHKLMYYTKETVLSVLEGHTFFWVERGGFGVNKSANLKVRLAIEGKGEEYNASKGASRGASFARNMLYNDDLRGIKFVTPRDKALQDIDEDEVNERAGTLNKRKLSLKRKQSLLEKHGSIETIRSYPEGVLIEVGEAFAVDIILHKLREYAKKLNDLNVDEDVEADTEPAEVNQEGNNNPGLTFDQMDESVVDPYPPALNMDVSVEALEFEVSLEPIEANEEGNSNLGLSFGQMFSSFDDELNEFLERNLYSDEPFSTLL